MFTGLCAFPLTPLHQQNIDEKAFIRILARLTDAGVDSLGILGSTGSYAYLSREQRKRVVQVAKAHAGPTPMMVGVGASQGWPLKEAAALAFPLTFAGAFLFMSTWYLCRALPVASFRWTGHGIAWFLTAGVLGNLWYQCGILIAKLWALHPGLAGLPARVRAA